MYNGTENKEIVKDTIAEAIENKLILESIPLLDKRKLREYYELNYKDSLKEMAKINTKDFTYFPYNKFDIKIWSNDHNPPHFHVICDGWDIIVNIEDGRVTRIKSVGKSSQILFYVEKNINKWLDCKSSRYKGYTNREVAMNTWEDEQAPQINESLTEKDIEELFRLADNIL